ncbi:MAG: HsdR family type I site-specific deoxyribonuclease [Lachnospiraceae bacterium]|nr:HsdR family type I site-specific deoxyribonuclease [Lachnospiraceae bacterium]
MAELESVIEKRLIDQLCCDESQWTYRPDIRTEQQLWENFKYILEQNNKAKLKDTPLSESEFAKIKNDLSHASFYDAGKWLIGENGKVYVHVQRGNETLHLVVMNNEHIAGGTSVYEVINQYQAFRSKEDEGSRDRRFDVSLLINGIPLIHIELKNKEHSYMDGFWQIKKYIAEGKFHGIFSNVQMFVVSNAVDTKYFAAARDTELNQKFMSRWLDKENLPVCDYIDFAKAVLKIPAAHEMVVKYTVLDNEKKRLLILRPYQIHAIEAMREASKKGKSGFIWHTTGSGKTMTSYKATRNLLMDIPSIDKTVFLIDRKDLDIQTKLAFQSYAQNDTIDVDDTDYVDTLIKRMMDDSRQMIVTTRQKMQIMVGKRLKEGTRQYEKIKGLKLAFVVDECHRAVTPQTKRDLEQFFTNSLWYGFTGTPIFEENKYEQKGDLPQTTDQLYGKNGRPLHSYTIKEAIHDEAVLGFMVENLGPKGISPEEERRLYDTETHMRSVLDVILNRSYAKFGMQNGRGRTYEALLTVGSIAIAQKYYDLLKKIKNGGDTLKISENMHKALPDFPKFAITYSISENEEASQVNQEKMKEALYDYNQMFGTHFGIEEINAYNRNLNDRLARKDKRYFNRGQQLDIVIVVDRLLTGFDAPCLSTLFIDRQPMTPQNIIQAFSRTNRLFNDGKQYGQIVTFQAHDQFKKAINDALMLYSRGGDGNPIAEDWDDVKESFAISLKAIRNLARTPEEIAGLSRKQKKAFVQLFRALDHDFAHLKSFSIYNDSVLDEWGFSESEYEDFAAMYKNVMEELKKPGDDTDPADEPVHDDYELVAYSRLRIDFEYIVELLQGFVESLDQSLEDYDEASFEAGIRMFREILGEFSGDNPKLSALLTQVVDEIEADREKYVGQDISVTINEMRYAAIDKEIQDFAEKWYLNADDVKYEAYNYRDGEFANENKLKDSADYAAYREASSDALPKFKFRKSMMNEFKEVIMPEIGPLID